MTRREIDRMLAKVPFAPAVAAMFAVVAVVLVSATPQWLFERWVILSGVADIIPAATPPLGGTARILAAIGAGGATAAMVWLGLTLVARLGQSVRPDDGEDAAPRDNSARRPLSAGNELGAPLMSDEAIAQARDELVLDVPLCEPEPEDASAPMAAADPGLAPSPPIVEVPERPVEPPPTTRQARHADGQSIQALLDRLEAAIARKPEGYRPNRADVSRLARALGR